MLGLSRLVGCPFVSGEVHQYPAMVQQTLEEADCRKLEAEQQVVVVRHIVEVGPVVVDLRRLEAVQVVVGLHIAEVELGVVVRHIVEVGPVMAGLRIAGVELEVVLHHTVVVGLEEPYPYPVVLVFQGLACRVDLGVLAFLEDHLQGLEELHHPVAQNA